VKEQFISTNSSRPITEGKVHPHELLTLSTPPAAGALILAVAVPYPAAEAVLSP
jgi:hypothetical protein